MERLPKDDILLKMTIVTGDILRMWNPTHPLRIPAVPLGGLCAAMNIPTGVTTDPWAFLQGSLKIPGHSCRGHYRFLSLPAGVTTDSWALLRGSLQIPGHPYKLILIHSYSSRGPCNPTTYFYSVPETITLTTCIVDWK